MLKRCKTEDKAVKKEMAERTSTNEQILGMITHNSERWCQLQAVDLLENMCQLSRATMVARGLLSFLCGRQNLTKSLFTSKKALHQAWAICFGFLVVSCRGQSGLYTFNGECAR